MSAEVRFVSLSVVLYAVSLPYIPRDINIPAHYLCSGMAKKVRELKEGIQIVEERLENSGGLKDFSRLKEKINVSVNRLVHYTWDEPMVAVTFIVERFFREKLDTSVQIQTHNVDCLRNLNDAYDKQIHDLAPVMELFVRIIKIANGQSMSLSFEISEMQEEIFLRERCLEEVVSAYKKIDMAAAVNALDKVTAIAQKTLTDPYFVRNLEASVKRLEKSEKDFEDAENSLSRARIKLNDTLSSLETLMSRCEELQVEQDQIYGDLQSKAADIINKSKESKQTNPKGSSYVSPVKVI